MTDMTLRQLWYRSVQCMFQVLLPLTFKLRVFGRTNVPAGGPVLIACNHQSYLDPVLIGVGLRREVHFLARDTLFMAPLFRRIIVSLNAMSVRHDETDLQAMRNALRVLKDDNMLLIFPEGTRTADGRLQHARPGWVLLAARSRAAVVPAIIEGAHQAWPRDALLPRPRPISVTFGSPFRVDGRSRDAGDHASRQLETEWNRLQETLTSR